jgi:hypothetical protein
MTSDVTIFSKISSKTRASLREMKEMAGRESDTTIPQYSNLRRVPDCFRRALPLNVMKQCQCVVVGCARGVLTVAISDQQDISVLDTLNKLTGRTIFPVLVSPVRMRLLIQRIENYKRNQGKAFKERSSLDPLYVHALVTPVTYMEKNKPGQ